MQLTVGDLICRVLPNGVDPDAPNKEADWSTSPFFPPDLFAVAAFLLQQSGAYQRIVAGTNQDKKSGERIVVTEEYAAELREIGFRWSSNAECPEAVNSAWARLLEFADDPIFAPHATYGEKTWYYQAFTLMAIADEACVDVGYRSFEDPDVTDRWVVTAVNSSLSGGDLAKARDGHMLHSRHVPSITSRIVDQDVVCVQPKARTPDVGCSLRNLSHNVALLPPRGVMRVHWLSPPAFQPVEDSTPLNLLLVPFPYRVEAEWFHWHPYGDPTTAAPWGWFDIEQQWLRRDRELVCDLVSTLLDRNEDELIHGVVFPEYSLDYETYENLATMLRDKYPTVQFLVAGTSANCNQEKGNYALATHFFADPALRGSSKSALRMMGTVSRPKHHRWSLEASQIAGYGLRGSNYPNPCSPKMRWWENISLKPREIHVSAMRGASVFSVMICEDLARSDPAHGPLRDIGPNLIFVLLMDGPQLEWRWAARYSTGLAEDPGSSVLTFTSRALLQRYNEQNPAQKSWSVGIWKDEATRACEIECPPESEGVIIRLRGKRQVEQTIDGRDNTQTFAWSIVGTPQAVSLDRVQDANLLALLNLAI